MHVASARVGGAFASLLAVAAAFDEPLGVTNGRRAAASHPPPEITTLIPSDIHGWERGVHCNLFFATRASYFSARRAHSDVTQALLQGETYG